MTDLHPRRLGHDEVRRRVGEFVELYRRVYAEPPYHEGDAEVAGFADRLTGQIGSDGFTFLFAEVHGTLVGYVYGLTFGPDRWWAHADRQPPETLGQPTYAVMELVIEKSYRGRGLGRGLVTTLLADRPEPYATLCANPVAPARQVYQHWGWRPVARAHRPGVAILDILLLPLPEASAQ